MEETPFLASSTTSPAQLRQWLKTSAVLSDVHTTLEKPGGFIGNILDFVSTGILSPAPIAQPLEPSLDWSGPTKSFMDDMLEKPWEFIGNIRDFVSTGMLSPAPNALPSQRILDRSGSMKSFMAETKVRENE